MQGQRWIIFTVISVRTVSLFSYSVEQNARDTKMIKRLIEGSLFFSGCRPRFPHLAALHFPHNIWRKRATARSLYSHNRLHEQIIPVFLLILWTILQVTH